jgi:hypothetical protein
MLLLEQPLAAPVRLDVVLVRLTLPNVSIELAHAASFCGSWPARRRSCARSLHDLRLALLEVLGAHRAAALALGRVAGDGRPLRDDHCEFVDRPDEGGDAQRLGLRGACDGVAVAVAGADQRPFAKVLR